jgi:hypothetical protein
MYNNIFKKIYSRNDGGPGSSRFFKETQRWYSYNLNHYFLLNYSKLHHRLTLRNLEDHNSHFSNKKRTDISWALVYLPSLDFPYKQILHKLKFS